MPKKYHALITDLDGTAVTISSDGGEVTDRTREAIQTAQARGFVIGCASGRRWALAKPVIRALGLSAPCILEGGALIVDPADGAILWQKCLEPTAPAEILAIFHDLAAEGILTTSADATRKNIQDIHKVGTPLRFMYLLGVTEHTAQRICHTVSSNNIAAAHMTPSWLGQGLMDVHVTHTEATKEHAIRVWQTVQKIRPAHTIGIGDSLNDLPLFRAAGLKIAIETGSEELRAQADRLAPPPQHEGLAHIVEQYFLTA